MELGTKALWVGAVGLTVAITGAVAAAGTSGTNDDANVSAGAPVTAAIAELNTTTTTEAPTTTTTTTTAPPTTTTTTTAPPPPTTTTTTAPPPPPPPPPTTQPPPPPPPPPSSANRDPGCESYMYNRINGTRADHGKPALSRDSGIQYIAVNWSDGMAGRQTLAHNPNYGSQIAAHRNYHTAGENVGRGHHTNTLFQAFMNSPSHRDNIVSDAYSHMTVGCVTDGGGQYWVTQNFWGR